MISAAGHCARVPDARATCVRTFCLRSAEKLLAGDKNTKRKHVISSLWYTHAVAICVCERERECVTIKTKCRTNSKHDTNILKQKPKYLFNTAKVCVCLLTFFFFMLSAEKLLTGDEKRTKKHVVSSLWYTEALQFCECVHERKVPGEQQAWHTKPVSIRQRIRQRQRCMCHNEKKVPGKQQARHKIYKHKAKKKKNSSGVCTACMCQNEKKALANRGKH